MGQGLCLRQLLIAVTDNILFVRCFPGRVRGAHVEVTDVCTRDGALPERSYHVWINQLLD
jgi:hypothetical protein